MKLPSALFLVAVITNILIHSSCSDKTEPEQESYRSIQWPSLMRNYSELDKNLGSYHLNQSITDASFTHFTTLLRDNNLSQTLIDKMTDLLQVADTDLERPAYHGFVHSARVGNVTASVLNTAQSFSLSRRQKIIITIAALFHDIDPDRQKGIPPRVSSTFLWMDKDQRAIDLFARLESEENIAKNQIKSVIKYTDFDIDPDKLRAIKAEADNMADQYFDKADADAIKLWGPRIAYIDQVAMYLGSFEFAMQAVVGLANELRAIGQHLAEEKGTLNVKVTTPTDVDVLSSTGKFLSPRIKDANFQILPKVMQDNFLTVQTSFETVWTGKKYVN